jgi:membrane-bound metal-dependent hydrolase YbcI (DUF457 family)
MAEAGLSRRYGRGATFCLFLASNLPDVDALWALAHGGGESFLLRRTLTHSVVGIPLLAAAAAGLFSRLYPHIGFRRLAGLFLLGMGVHAFMDLINSYGVVLFYPLSRWRPELAWVFIIDLALWALLLAACLPALFRRSWRETAARVFGGAAAAYVLFCGVSRAAAGRVLEKTAEAEGLRPSFAYVFPEALGPHRFRGVLKQDGVYRMYLLRPWSGAAEPAGQFPTEEDDRVVAAVRRTERARRLETFFKAPVWRVSADGRSADVYDLRFKSVVLPRRGTPFAFHLTADEEKGDPR